MAQGMLHLHNVLRWFIVIFALITLIKGLAGMNGKKAFSNADKRYSLLLMITADIQLLLGLYLYWSRGWFDVVRSGADVMGNKMNRFFGVEHISGMLIGLILIHLGYSAAKNARLLDATRFKRMFWYTFIGLIIIAATVPWPFREVVGRPLLPGM